MAVSLPQLPGAFLPSGAAAGGRLRDSFFQSDYFASAFSTSLRTSSGKANV